MNDKNENPPPSPQRQDSVKSPSDPLGGSGRWLSSPFSFFKNDQPEDDQLFVDRDFPTGDVLEPTMKWRRPKDICPSPQFIVDGTTRMDICQGLLNDCWFLSAVASLSMHRPLLERVVPVGQSFQEGYNGRFHFQFWQYGRWEQVTVDDLLPTKDGKLVYLRSSDQQEFWSALLEKAYAKLKGGYRALNMGFPHEAMVDMTGGVTEVLQVTFLPRDMLTFLRPLLDRGALINCANTQGALEQKNQLGIMFRHAYSITGLEQVKNRSEVVDLVRVRNPWGRVEWKGPWSDSNGPEWSKVSEEEQKRLNRVVKDDGEFWMQVSDFRQNFDMMEVCHLSEETLSQPASTQHPWHCTLHQGSWVERLSAGGSPRGGWYWLNPQFHLTLLEEDDDPCDPEISCSLLVALMQKHQRRTGVNLAIAVDIYQARIPGSYLSSLDLGLLRPVLSSGDYTPRREVVIRSRLAPGHYIIIPSTEQANQQGEFILRVLTEKGNAAKPAEKPGTADITLTQPLSPHLPALPSIEEAQALFKKHCNKRGQCRPLELFNLLTEAIRGGVLAGCEKTLSLEHCKTFVVLMDTQGLAQLDWMTFKTLWDKIRFWTNIFLKFDRNKSQHLEYPEVAPALKTAGLQVDDFILQLIGLRYTEPDMTISYPGFLYLLMKLESMIRKFQAYDMVGMGTISINYRQWLHMTMYS